MADKNYPRKYWDPRTWFPKKKSNADSLRDKFATSSGFIYRETGSIPFNGEKTPGLAGPMINYAPDHQALVIRSWQAMMESGPAKIAITRRVRWIIGKGLKLQSEPIEFILNDEGIKFDKEKFIKSVEARWNLWRTLKISDFSGRRNLNQMSKAMEKNADVGGDLLIVLRVIKGNLKIQLIDGAHIQSPLYGTEHWPQELSDGHLIIDGVEYNAQKEEVAYYVRTYAMTASMENLMQYNYERVEAWGKASGMRMAYLYRGDEFRLDTVRGMPRMATFTEKLTNLDTYSNATLKQAQEASKVDYQVVHEKDAAGNMPWAANIASSLNGGGASSNSDNPVTDDGEEKSKTIHITNIGDAYNNPPGAEIKMLENKNPLYFKEFNDTHRDEFFAGMELPPNVAMSKYDDSFSASRAATKDWDHTIDDGREHHKQDAIMPIFILWLDLEILNGNIHAPGYVSARLEDNEMVLAAYRNIRLIGVNVPHIDPVKEATAARIKLGSAGAHIPLGDGDRVTEDLGMGDFNENIEQFGKDLKLLEQFGINLPQPAAKEGSPPKKKKKEDDEG
jgi:capsid protein